MDITTMSVQKKCVTKENPNSNDNRKKEHEKYILQEHPLSWFQERMWIINRKNPKDVSYDIPIVFFIEGELDLKVLNKSITEIVKRQESLRTRFTINSAGKPVQIVMPPQPFALEIVDVKETEVPNYIEENMHYVFDLENGPVFIGKLLRFNQQQYLLLLNIHHIVADGWSVENILFSELLENYEAFSTNKKPLFKPLPMQYTDFAHWQRKVDFTEELSFWQKYLSDYEASLELPSDFSRTPQSGSSNDQFKYQYSLEFSQALEQFSQAHGCTMFMALLASYALTISRYTGKNDLCIGTTTSGRIFPEIERLIGFFVNILPLRLKVDESMSVNEFMANVRSSTLAGFEHQVVPYEYIVYSSVVERTESSGSIVPLVIRHQNFPHAEINTHGDVKFGSYPGYEGYRTAKGKGATARCEVEMSYTGDRNNLEVEITYASDLYRKETIQQLLSHHELLLREMMADSQKKLSELTILTDTDRQRLFVEFNQTKRDIDFDNNFVKRWDTQVAVNSDSIACYDSFGSWCYRDIAVASNALFLTLTQRNIGSGDIVGVCLDRGAPLLSSMLAIWRAGAAYVPLDPAYPETYLKQIINDACPKMIICTNSQYAKLNLQKDKCYIIDAVLPFIAGDIPVQSTNQIQPDSLAYLMYTSGSTGIPKGAKVPHRQLMNWLAGLESSWPFVSGEVIAQKTTMAFAVSVKEIFAGLLNGCPIVFVDTNSVKDPALFVEVLRKFNVTRVNLVPSHLKTVLSYLKKEGISLPSLQLCITAGEPLVGEIVMAFRELLPHAKLVNNYGCTEINDMTYYDTSAFDGVCQEIVPVGKPILNTQIYVLDRLGRPVPQGVAGEVYVATVGMTLGYHNLDELNKSRFVKNPFSSDYGGMLYNTGDVVRYLPDGNLEFLERWDFQIKVRGFRVDVCHVEKVIGDFVGIAERAVVGESGQLTAYYIPQRDCSISLEKFREFLQQRLPLYMVPTVFIELKEMPKLPNGKLDRRALNISLGIIQQSDNYEAPLTECEKIIAEIWAEVLEFPEENIGKKSHFFELGGHSLSATRFIARIKEQMNIEVGLSLIFEYPRLDDLAKNLTLSTKLQDSDDEVMVRKSQNNKFNKHQTLSTGLLQDKVVLVTGGSRGIGRSTVRLLASHGASVAINYLKNNDKALMLKEIVDEDGGIAEVFQADTTSPDQVENLVNQVKDRFGKIDVLVTNAGIGFSIVPFINSNWVDFERKLTNEIKSMYLLCKAVVPGMIERKNGSIIAVSSTMSKNVQFGYCSHGTSKAALDSFVRSLANELGSEGIRVNTVAPGLTLTDATAPMSPSIKQTAAARCPLRRNGLPRDVAGAILFLASDLSQFMTGTYLPVDGGYTML